ncbi:neuronal acetylcholine receptor subunit alpha-3 isoform X1 [Hydra vulgaris]|uniref:neuronal acetylcholine receptor subunit alpha-3 isoform X1 n=1 Tax=Hydra vulgaris TaxID=6087 RepID=UPI001F5F51FF|nr:neuronal acetylcholine receptor subunit alpha-3 isoform X1 [Hydra vulgaris]
MITVLFVGVVLRNVLVAYHIEENLHANLFRNYDPDFKPNKNVNLTFDIALSKLLKLNEKNEVLHLYVWVRQYWHEKHFQWNASDWEGISSVTVSSNRIWKPDITLYNNADAEFQGLDVYGKTKATINNDGSIIWLLPIILRSSCKIDTKYFPFDEQKCLLIFGSWSNDYRGIDIYPKNSRGDLSKLNENGQFIISGFDVTRRLENFTCCFYPFVTLTYEIIIQRRAKFYLFKIILPGIYIALLSCFSFVIPPVTGERASLVMGNFLSLLVYVLIISDSVPASSDSLPLLVIFYKILLFVIGLALTASCLIYYMCVKTVPVPKWLKVIFLQNHFVNLYRIIAAKYCRSKKSSIKFGCKNQKRTSTNSHVITSHSPKFYSIHHDRNLLDLKKIYGITKSCDKNEITYLKHIEEYLNSFSLRDSIRSDWEDIAYVLDKLLLYGFTLLIGISVIFIFAYPPNVVF